MINIFNRKELITTFDINIQSSVRRLMAQNGIKYLFRTVNWSNGMQATPMIGENIHRQCQYLIYVHKNDYQKASAIINGLQISQN